MNNLLLEKNKGEFAGKGRVIDQPQQITVQKRNNESAQF
jgi:hypothetical protein